MKVVSPVVTMPGHTVMEWPCEEPPGHNTGHCLDVAIQQSVSSGVLHKTAGEGTFV